MADVQAPTATTAASAMMPEATRRIVPPSADLPQNLHLPDSYQLMQLSGEISVDGGRSGPLTGPAPRSGRPGRPELIGIRADPAARVSRGG
ncbi:hypothetical protein GCM10009733_060670 [Nonomuraea maheshkhaliensis]|uniref:Uncharacterized protein n=1 Tax=Nonomuraea maheshkhaliensis TaxID=419590 RepID=A0ABP4RJ42_9ACTN